MTCAAKVAESDAIVRRHARPGIFLSPTWFIRMKGTLPKTTEPAFLHCHGGGIFCPSILGRLRTRRFDLEGSSHEIREVPISSRIRRDLTTAVRLSRHGQGRIAAVKLA